MRAHEWAVFGSKIVQMGKWLIERWQWGIGELDRGFARGFFSSEPEGKQCLSTGILELDAMLEGGGWPCGQWIDIQGDEGTGKTSLALASVRACQQAGYVACYIDSMRQLQVEHARQMGVCVDELLVLQPSSAEQAFASLQTLLARPEVGLVVLDDLDAWVWESELAEDWGQDTNVPKLRGWSYMFHRMIGVLCRSRTVVLCLRTPSFSQQTDTPREDMPIVGLELLSCFAAVRLHLSRRSLSASNRTRHAVDIALSSVVAGRLSNPSWVVWDSPLPGVSPKNAKLKVSERLS